MCIFAVTPLAGVWIEIIMARDKKALESVTPLAGVWIEISDNSNETETLTRHSPCGSVD